MALGDGRHSPPNGPASRSARRASRSSPRPRTAPTRSRSCRYAIERVKQIAARSGSTSTSTAGRSWIEGATADPDDEAARQEARTARMRVKVQAVRQAARDRRQRRDRARRAGRRNAGRRVGPARGGLSRAGAVSRIDFRAVNADYAGCRRPWATATKSPSCRRFQVADRMFDKLNAVESRYGELVTLLADPAVQNDTTKYREHAKALSEIRAARRHIQRVQARRSAGDRRAGAGARRRRRDGRARARGAEGARAEARRAARPS